MTMTLSVRAIALSVVIAVSVTGCGAAQAVLGVHDAPKANQASAPLTFDQAKRILTRAFTAAQQAETTTGATAQMAQKTAYTGERLRAVRAAVRLAPVQPTVLEPPVLAPQQPGLLALSRGFGYPRVMLAQTVGSRGSLPILHVLTTPDAATPYRISASATMLLASKINRFDPLTQGSPRVTDGTGVAVAPTSLLNAYAAGMAFPAKAVARAPFAADPFAAQVRDEAARVAKAVARQATFSQVHKVVPNTVYALRQASGDALVFGVIERTDFFKVKSGQAVNTSENKAFVLLSHKKRVTKAAKITTLEFLVFAVPRSSGPATLVAASEQVVAGAGS
jgi:hypothetical protein